MLAERLHPWPLIRWAHRRLVALGSRAIDVALGVETTLDPLPTPWRDYDPYLFCSKPSGWIGTFALLRMLKVGPNDAFLDLGSGAGRVVLVASLFPFRRVIGVEQGPSLHESALQNVLRMRHGARARIELVCADACTYRVPDCITVVFMYNPFRGEVFARSMANVFASLDRAPRRLRLVYRNPQEHAFLERTGRCRLVRRIRGLRPGSDWALMLSTYIYELDARPQARRPA